ncbi:ribonuclease H-like domain-containing protein, partial [Panaeolus papilionaceus]
VRKVAFKTIHSSTLLLPAWKRCLKDLGIAIRLIPRDVRTRWNSTYDMLKFVLDHKRAYQSFTADAKNGLRDYELQDSKWDVLKELCAILKILKHATLFFSRSTPSLAYVIPVMDHMNDQFTETANNKNLSPAIRTAVGLAKRTLNRYYSRTDDSETYRIAMSKFLIVLFLT